MAPAYDAFTVDHDYELWIGNLLPEVEKRWREPPQRRLLDVACGTGKSFLPMLDRGWRVTGCDISPEMVEVARGKVGGTTNLSVADMRDLPVYGEFDLVWCVCDALNYVLSETELVQALSGMGRNLAADGILAFDLNTLHSFRTFFVGESAVERDGVRMIWRGMGEPDAQPRTTVEALFLVEPTEAAAGRARIQPEVHRERHYPEADVLEALMRSGLECVGVFGHHYDAVFEQPLDESRHTKAVYLAKRAGWR